MPPCPAAIPPRLHFCWIGATLTWPCVFALLSAAERSGFTELFLHHTDILHDSPQLRALARYPAIRLTHIDPVAYLTQTGAMIGLTDQLAALYAGLSSPVKRADVLRVAILYREGGIYLDLDTITVADLHPLLGTGHFFGAEIIVWPPAVRNSRSPFIRARHLALDLLRKILRRLPNGWIGFRRVERLYAHAINNAVMGATAHSALLAGYLEAMVALPAGRRRSPYAFGPHLLQTVLAGQRSADLVIHGPSVFYPLPPEISDHWFRIRRRVSLNAVLTPQARVVHWYASVRTRHRAAQIDPGYIERHRDTQLYSSLVCACIPNLRQFA